MLYYIYPTSQRVVIERPSTLQSTLTLDDYLQLQLLLRHEQRRRCEEREQQYRVTQALHNLKVLKEHYRRERAQRIQRLMDHYRRKALMSAAAQQDAVYRQWLASALEQRRSEEIWRQYQAARQSEQQQMLQQQQQQEEEQEESDDESEAVEEDKGFEDFHANQLARILKLLFGQQEQEDTLHQQMDEAESGASEEDEESQAHDLWNYISTLQQQQQQRDDDYTNEPSDEEQEQEKEEPMDVSSPVAEPVQESQPVMQDKKVPSTTPKAIASEPEDKYEDILENWPKQQQQQQKEREPVSVTRENAPMPQATSLQQERHHAPSPDPPLQGRVLNLKDLLDELVSNEQQQVPEACQEEQEQKPAYAPKHVVTPAEPATSNIESASSQQQQQLMDDEDPPNTTPTAAADPTAAAQRVHEIAEQQKRNLPPSEPVIQHPELLQVQRELEDMEKDRLPTVLKTPLQFKPSEQGGTLQLTATTPNNREFLGCEDAIMRIMIKLDTIESHGDEKIRNQRRSLVKRAEGMLEKLDEHKEHEWQRARKLTALKNTSSGKKKHHKQRHRRHHPKQPVTVG